MIDDTTKKDIEKISYEVLKQSKSFDVFPTPINNILGHTELTIDNGIDLRNVDYSFIEKLKDKSADRFKILQSGLSKIKGLFFRPEKVIYVDLSQTTGRQNFVKLHEVGHGLLPWQNEIMLALDDNETLKASFEDQFEAEANYFASITLFQQDRFMTEMHKLNLSIDSAMALAKKFGSSVHSSLRNYVLKSKNRCALLVLNPIKKNAGNGSICSKRNLFHSQSFVRDIGELKLPEEYGYKWDFARHFKFGQKYKKGEISLETINDEYLDCSYQYFFNSFNIFVFIFPKGEVNKSKTQVILQNI
ncbi:uncharacterized protein DUF955 [Gillisia sp. Hel_I_86]|uniref:ImmA/IrrE family metallo-endopeptidase n=1 Tax=Gillisia sp. Hel_I_86 TaxID=1249981 RepID=UPI00119944F1|nr:ImmA/IrrE family metallo-endopeptidase [Gillisia sp. Hel_I_86]TVZ26097.1 uncharacterized protein DUF955 [Gillisia sp. Hel_I_86]